MKIYNKKFETKKVAYVKDSDYDNSILPLNNKTKITHTKLNPTHYNVSIQNAQDKFLLVFSETYQNYWKIFSKDKTILNQTNFKHIQVNKYANGWIIDPKNHCKDGCDKNDDGTYNFEFEIVCTPELLENKLEKLILLPIGITMLLFIFMNLLKIKRRR